MFNNVVKLFSLLTLLCLAGACRSSENTAFEYMPGMMDTAIVKAQREPMRSPVEGTIPQGFEPYPYAQDERLLAGSALKNPLLRTKEILLHGQEVFNTFCAVCHGPKGLSNGYIVPKYPKPPMLASEKIQNWSDGEIFHVITKGQNLMWPYASQIKEEDRWAIVHYIRALQRANRPTHQDVDAFIEWLTYQGEE